jgi:glycosyltransferase involved in cell wall biosynthesis
VVGLCNKKIIMNNLLVSIIVPIYNSEAFLDKCIQSVINQSYKNIEIILVNDGSTDISGKVCDNYATIDNRIKVIHKINGGLVSSRKTGLKASTGEYILYIDGDDWIESDLIKQYIEQVLNFNADVVVSSHIVNLEGREDILMNSLPPGVYNKDKLKTMIYPKMLYTGNFSQFGVFSYSWGKLYRRELLLENQLSVTEDITIGEDALCLYPTLLDANTLVILEQPYYHYRQRADSLIKTLRTIDISKMEKVYNDLKKIFYDRGVLDIMLPQLQYYLLSLLTINTEGPNTDDVTNLYPFNNVKPGANLVICGGGTFGQHLYKKINNYKSHNVVAWIDKKHEHYSKLNLPVIGFDQIESLKYDAILIALIDEDNSNQAYLKLIEHGVNKNKIIQIFHYNKKENVQELLSKFKINL